MAFQSTVLSLFLHAFDEPRLWASLFLTGNIHFPGGVAEESVLLTVFQGCLSILLYLTFILEGQVDAVTEVISPKQAR
jgi:hypothetical protein